MLTFLEVLIVLVPILIGVAFITIIERKVLASIQRRVGPNAVGYFGVLQPFSDALKLILKETIMPQYANRPIYVLAPIISLVFSLLGWAVIPFNAYSVLTDFSLGLLYSLAISSIGIYGVLWAGWGANSKYAFLGSLRSTAQIVSYELVLSSAVLGAAILVGSFNYNEIINAQEAIYLMVPLFPVFLIYFISALAETNRVPFDLVEAESELVSGYFTEHSATLFVFFFLAEYNSIILMSVQTAVLFIGGYLPYNALSLGLKTGLFCFVFVWFRATLPRLRYDRLIEVIWTQILPLIIALLILICSLVIAFDLT